MGNELGRASDDAPFELRVSLRDTDLFDSFVVTLHPRFARRTLGDLIKTVFPEDGAASQEINEGMDVRANPDLPEIYLSLSEIFDTWRRGDCALHFFANGGPEIQLSESVRSRMDVRNSAEGTPPGSPILDLVVEQTFDVLAKFEEWGGDKSVLLQWLQGYTLLYFMDKHGFQLPADPQDEAARRVLTVALGLQARGLLSSSEQTGRFEIAEEGRQDLGEMIAETESYIDQFDVFKDVAYDLDAEMVEFGRGHGADYRVQVYDAEGLDVVRTVFLLRLYDGTLDEHSESWLEDIHSADFFNEVLRPVLDRDWVDEEILDWIIESGFAHNEEQAEASRERESQQAIIRRIKSE
ncbi:MAG: hypothetical protein IIB14_01260 [Chloroflexi bacterium]|nr:hypothetical protein [Chloroflexota bacterium]